MMNQFSRICNALWPRLIRIYKQDFDNELSIYSGGLVLIMDLRKLFRKWAKKTNIFGLTQSVIHSSVCFRSNSASKPSMSAMNRSRPSSYKQTLLADATRKLTGGLYMMISLVLKICCVLCMRNELKYQREIMCSKFGSRILSRF